MSPAMPTPEQVRSRLTVLVQRPQVNLHVSQRPRAGKSGSQMLYRIREPGQLLGADQPVELGGITTVVQPLLLLPPGKSGRASQNLLSHLGTHVNGHTPVHVRELRVEHRRGPTIRNAPRT